MKQKNLIIGFSVLALVALAVYFFWYRKTKPGASDIITGIDKHPFPLKKGSTGAEVMQLQKYLIKEYGAKISATNAIDGIWGELTDEAVKTFLKRDNVSLAIYTKFRMAEY